MVLTKAWYFVIFNHFSTCHNAHILYILILFVKICDKEIDNLFGSVPLFKQFAYTNGTQFSMSR